MILLGANRILSFVRDAGIREAEANQDKMKARYENDAKIAQSQRDFELKKAAYDKEVGPLFFHYIFQELVLM